MFNKLFPVLGDRSVELIQLAGENSMVVIAGTKENEAVNEMQISRPPVSRAELANQASERGAKRCVRR
ncbi:MAG: hypothetical protein ACOVLE_08600 [Pirellula staleyi]